MQAKKPFTFLIAGKNSTKFFAATSLSWVLKYTIFCNTMHKTEQSMLFSWKETNDNKKQDFKSCNPRTSLNLCQGNSLNLRLGNNLNPGFSSRPNQPTCRINLRNFRFKRENLSRWKATAGGSWFMQARHTIFRDRAIWAILQTKLATTLTLQKGFL